MQVNFLFVLHLQHSLPTKKVKIRKIASVTYFDLKELLKVEILKSNLKIHQISQKNFLQNAKKRLKYVRKMYFMHFYFLSGRFGDSHGRARDWFGLYPGHSRIIRESCHRCPGEAVTAFFFLLKMPRTNVQKGQTPPSHSHMHVAVWFVIPNK